MPGLPAPSGHRPPDDHQVARGGKDDPPVDAVVSQEAPVGVNDRHCQTIIGGGGKVVMLRVQANGVLLRVVPLQQRTDRLGAPGDGPLHLWVQCLNGRVEAVGVDAAEGREEILQLIVRLGAAHQADVAQVGVAALEDGVEEGVRGHLNADCPLRKATHALGKQNR